MSEWIKVEERLPAYGVSVLVVAIGGSGNKAYTTATLCSIQSDFREDDSPFEDRWYQTVSVARQLREITHWMPLPPLPAE